MKSVSIRGFRLDPDSRSPPSSTETSAGDEWVTVSVELPADITSVDCSWLMQAANEEFSKAGVEVRLVGLVSPTEGDDDDAGSQSVRGSSWMIDPATRVETLDLNRGLEAVFICDKLCEKSKSGKSDNVSASEFEFFRQLGEGSAGQVFQVKRRKTGKMYAVKMVEKRLLMGDHKKYSQALTERQILIEARHPFIVQLHWTFQTRLHLYFVLEFCPGGELYYHLARVGRFDENSARFYFSEILLGLEYLHAGNILHRDLKLENILLDEEGHVRLTDFGLSKVVCSDQEKSNSFIGTSEYFPPEMIRRDGYSKPLDFYSLGCVLYFMLTGRLPHFRGDLAEMARMRLKGAPPAFPADVSVSAQHLCRRLLDPDPVSRIGSKSGADEIRIHPWLAGVDWDRVRRKQYKPPIDPRRFVDNFDQEFTNRKLPPVVAADGIEPEQGEVNRVPNWSFSERGTS